MARLGLGQRSAAGRAGLHRGGEHDALDVPLHRFHVDGGAVGGNFEQLEAFCRARSHPCAAECERDPGNLVLVTLVGEARL